VATVDASSGLVATIKALKEGKANITVTTEVGAKTDTCEITVTTNLTAPVFTVHPANKSIPAGRSVIFSAYATGNPEPKYQWEFIAPNSKIWRLIEDFFDSISVEKNQMTIHNVTAQMDGYMFRCVTSNSVKTGVVSGSATLTVLPETESYLEYRVMEADNYPTYFQGQFLTSESLNSSFNYLDEQLRMSRCELLGYGILEGLAYSFDAESCHLTVYRGKAVTSDGYLILFPNDMKYACMAKREDLSQYNFYSNSKKEGYFARYQTLLEESYLFYENEDDIKEIKAPSSSALPVNFPAGYALCIFVELAVDATLKCNQMSCDVNHSIVNVVYRPVFIDKTKLKEMKSSCSELNILKTSRTASNNLVGGYYGRRDLFEQVERLELAAVALSESASGIVAQSQIRQLTDTIGIISSSLRDSIDGLNKEPSKTVNTTASQFVLHDEVKDLFDKNKKSIVTSITALNAAVIKAGVLNQSMLHHTKDFDAVSNLSLMAEDMKEIPPYYLLFLEDIKTAVNEFASFHNAYIHTYPLHKADKQEERLIVLGTGTTSPAEDLYRNAFRHAAMPQQQTLERDILSRLFIRIHKLIESFVGKEVPTTVKLVPSRDNSAKLEERSIPYYYNYKEISDFWNAFSPVQNKEIFHYQNFANANLDYNLEKFPFFRLEGYYNVDSQRIMDHIESLIDTYDLPIRVEFDSINNIKNHKPAEYLGGVYKYNTLVLLYDKESRVIMDLNKRG